MRRTLTIVTLGLFALVVADRLAKTAGTTLASQGASASVQPAADRGSGAMPPRAGRSAAVLASGSSLTDRLSRLATRRQLGYLASGTYLDSLIAITDSVLRRWPDRFGNPLRVFVIQGGPPGYDSRMAGLVREALDRW